MTADTVYLPPDEELEVTEIRIGSPALRAAAMHLGKYCDMQSKEFMLCKAEERDPRKCINEGKAVTACGMEFFKKVKKACKMELQNYSKCLEWTTQQFRHEYCRGNQGIWEDCMMNKLGLERPPFGYFAQVRLHISDRPKPVNKWPDFYADQTPGLPKDYEKPKASMRNAVWP